MSKKILLVDDAAITINIITEILVKHNYEIVGTAENGNIAYEKYKQLKPDLVIMDITMPECDGLESIDMIMKYDVNAKIIVCSALGQKKFVLEAVKKGAIDYLLKPFNEEKMVEIVKKAFKSEIL
jgi:two-component system, chemotaxis family, chemotaxis protein CheY